MAAMSIILWLCSHQNSTSLARQRNARRPGEKGRFESLLVIVTQGNIDDDVLELLGNPLDKFAAIAAIGVQLSSYHYRTSLTSALHNLLHPLEGNAKRTGELTE